MKRTQTLSVLAIFAIAGIFLFQNCSDTSFKKRSKSKLQNAQGVVGSAIGLYDRAIYVGDSTTFEIGVVSDPSDFLTYRWYKDGQEVQGQNNMLDVNNAQLSDAGKYSVEVYKNGQFAESDMALLEVLACRAGETQSCSVSGGSGVRTCKGDGSGFGACQATKCNSGYSLSGGSCKANRCNLPWGGSIGHGQSVKAWNASSSTSCKSQTRKCNNGSLSGNYRAKSCAKKCNSGYVLRSGKCLIAKKTITLGSRGCGSGYCSTNKPKKGGGNKAHCATKDRNKANAICRHKGYARSTGTMHFSSRGKKARYCGPTGKGCFINQNNSCNRYFTKLTCAN